MIIGFLLAIIGHAGLYFVGNDINLMLPCWVIGNIGQGIACSIPFAMLSDTVDYNEWKTGVRASGFLTAISSAFCIKAGAGIGGFISRNDYGRIQLYPECRTGCDLPHGNSLRLYMDVGNTLCHRHHSDAPLSPLRAPGA